MKLPIVEDLVDAGFFPNDAELIHLIKKGCNRNDAFLAACDLLNREYDFISPSCEKITGYPPEKFLTGGPQFVFEQAVPSDIPGILEAQERYMKQAKSPGFDPRQVIIHEYYAGWRLPYAFTKPTLTLAVAIVHTPQMDYDRGFSITCEYRENTIRECKEILTQIKIRHNQIAREPSSATNISLSNSNPQKQLSRKLTEREEEVLRAIAKGKTTRQIASELFIEETTVETHRKNLFKKIEAKNVAELIKKASKIYWLD